MTLGTSNFKKMQEMVEKYNCTIRHDPNISGIPIQVNKMSKLNSMQIANIFYESGHFVFAEPILLGRARPAAIGAECNDF